MIEKIQKWVLSWSFIQDAFTYSWEKNKEELYRKAFKDARADIEETRVDDIDDKAKEMAEELVRKLLGVIDEKIVVTINEKTGLIFVGGKVLDEARILSLQAEANYYFQSDLWKIINETIKDQAQKVMFEKSETFQDMANGKAWLYLLSLQNKILKIFSNYKPKPKTPMPPKV